MLDNRTFGLDNILLQHYPSPETFSLTIDASSFSLPQNTSFFLSLLNPPTFSQIENLILNSRLALNFVFEVDSSEPTRITPAFTRSAMKQPLDTEL